MARLSSSSPSHHSSGCALLAAPPAPAPGITTSRSPPTKTPPLPSGRARPPATCCRSHWAVARAATRRSQLPGSFLSPDFSFSPAHFKVNDGSIRLMLWFVAVWSRWLAQDSDGQSTANWQRLEAGQLGSTRPVGLCTVRVQPRKWPHRRACAEHAVRMVTNTPCHTCVHERP